MLGISDPSADQKDEEREDEESDSDTADQKKSLMQVPGLYRTRSVAGTPSSCGTGLCSFS